MKKIDTKPPDTLLENICRYLRCYLPGPVDALSTLKNSGILDTIEMKDSNSEHYADQNNPLYSIFNQSTGGDISKWHHYFDIYHQFFGQFRKKKGLRILEIGIARGGSLILWREYFDKTTKIVGIDVNPQCTQFEDAKNNILVRIGNQADQQFLSQITEEFSEFDIIIDDGGHTTNQQITSFANLYPALSETGIYLVEDTHTNFWQNFRDRDDGVTFLDLAKALSDHLYDPYMDLTAGKPLRIDNPDKLHKIEVSKFYANTRSISFFDSIVVFCKGKRGFPKSEIK